MQKKNILIVGGTSVIAEHCVRIWLSQQPCDLILVGRNNYKLQRVAKDLICRWPQTNIQLQVMDFLDANVIQSYIQTLTQDFAIDIALIAHGSLPLQEECQLDIVDCKHSLEINGISPVLFAEAIIQSMIKNNHGKLGIIGSVAGDRGRGSNYIYGASKSLIDTYAQGLQHRLALRKSAVTVTLIKPGPTATPMTKDLVIKGKLADPKHVAKNIIKAISNSRKLIYTPSKWLLIMLIIKNLPSVIFNKMDI
ncbi:SDR family NAD(P)-dependent oxidoreductase [Psychrobacter maritimus]|uniref:SDR family NAD(P)-dependent oxidoreductase n=1 Tax=Psychrobacter maritimus TaxID=256325 RepID=UPI0019185658|nr:SDR family NAD(P)-dependent oxidoreductase [Psychrobacter maritimus]